MSTCKSCDHWRNKRDCSRYPEWRRTKANHYCGEWKIDRDITFKMEIANLEARIRAYDLMDDGPKIKFI
jgi:hypothetical protein